jgi:oxygen-independent coproporphyrinogen-3 oxidase
METVSPELLRRFDVRGQATRHTPRPTGLWKRLARPTTPRRWRSGGAGPAALALPLSLYVHMPFCESLCYYCACNKIITKHKSKSAGYLRYLAREIDLHVAELAWASRSRSCTWAAARPRSCPTPNCAN